MVPYTGTSVFDANFSCKVDSFTVTFPDSISFVDPINTDYHLMASLYNDASDTSVFTAWPCALDEITKRPIFGAAKINLSNLDYEQVSLMDNVELFMHEIFHALGFTPDLW